MSSVLLTEEDKIFFSRVLRSRKIGGRIKPHHSKYGSIYEWVCNLPKKQKAFSFVPGSSHDCLRFDGDLLAALNDYAKSNGRLDLKRLVLNRNVYINSEESFTRLFALGSWLLTEEPEILVHKLVEDERVFMAARLVEEQSRRYFLLEKKRNKATKNRNDEVKSDPNTKIKTPDPEWGRIKPAKIEGDGNAWREQD